MKAGLKFSPIKVKESLICDGHHRYIASALAKYSLEIIAGGIGSGTTSVRWELVVFDNEDWDTPAKIDRFNKEDAVYNDISIDAIVELLK